jgi:hypothetical protein
MIRKVGSNCGQQMVSLLFSVFMVASFVLWMVNASIKEVFLADFYVFLADFADLLADFADEN